MLNSRHTTGLKALTDNWQPFKDLAHIEVFIVFDDLAQMNLADMKIEQLTKNGSNCGFRHYFKRR